MLERVLRSTQAPETLPPRTWLVDLVTAVTVLSAGVLSFFAQDLFERVTMISGIVVCVAVWRLSRDPLLVVTSNLLVMGAFFGWGLSFYDAIWWYDDMAHFLFSLLAVMALARLVLHRVRVDAAWLALVGVWLSWLGIASLWEIGEWVSDQLAATYHSRGYFDTMMDMILNSTGSAIGVALYWTWFRTEADRRIVFTRE